jgi:hypothetical protein
MTGLKRATTGLMEINGPQILCPSEEAVIDVFTPSQRIIYPSFVNIEYFT